MTQKVERMTGAPAAPAAKPARLAGMSSLPFAEKQAILAKEYSPSIHKIGLIVSIVHIVIMLLPGLVLALFYDAFPGWGMIMAGVVPIWTALAIVYVMEPVQYFLALGTVGTYVSFLAGNISNIRLPTAIATTEVVGVEPGTPEGEIVSGISIIVSQWVLVAMTLFAALGVTAVVGILPPFITKAFDFLIPALFGGMLVNIGMYQWRYLIVTVVAALALFVVGVPAKFITLIMVVFMIALSYIFYKRVSGYQKPPWHLLQRKIKIISKSTVIVVSQSRSASPAGAAKTAPTFLPSQSPAYTGDCFIRHNT